MFGTLLWIIGVACFIWVLYDVLANQKSMTTGMKVLWIVLAVFFSIITAIIYYFVVKNPK